MATSCDLKKNKILAELKAQELARLERHLEWITFTPGHTISRQGEPIEYLYFPTTLVTSVLAEGADGAQNSLLVIGSEGVLGGYVALGGRTMPHELVALNNGGGYRLRNEIAAWEFREQGSLLWKILQHMQIVLFCISQTVLCNQSHSIEQRLSRWFLDVSERAGGESLQMTHVFIASQLGVRREAITEAAHRLQQEGLIDYTRGVVVVRDRLGLCQKACHCYETVRLERDSSREEHFTVAQSGRPVRPDLPTIQRQAEERAKRSRIEIPSSPSDFRKLYYELEVRKHMQAIQMEELLESYAEIDRFRERYADIYDFSPVAYASVDAHGVLTQINLSGAILLGIKGSEVTRHRLVDSIAPDKRSNFASFLGQILKDSAHYRLETTLEATDKRPEASVIIDGIADEERVECRLVISDVTREKAYQHTLSRAYHLLDLSQCAADAGSWDWDMATGLVTWSDNLYRLFGLDSSQIQSSHEAWLSVLYPDDVKNAEDHIKQAIRDRQKYFSHYRICTPRGEVRWINSVGEIGYDAEDKVLRMSGICIDVTEQMETELIIRENLARLNEAEEIAHLGNWKYVVANNQLSWSDEVFRILGYAPQSFDPSTEKFLERIHPDDRERLTAAVEETLRGEGNSLEIEHRIVTPSGELRHVIERCRHLKDADGLLLESQGIMQDVTQARSAQEEMRRNEERFRTIADYTYDWEYWQAPDGQLLYTSPSGERISGYSRDEFLTDQELIKCIVYPEDLHNFSADFEGCHPLNVRELEFRIVRKDGGIRWIGSCEQPVYSTDGRYLGRRVSNRDITKNKEAETQRRL